MESIHGLVIMFLFVVAIWPDADGFSVKKRSESAGAPPGEKTGNQLVDAMRVIQRAKRRAFFNELTGRTWSTADNGGYFGDDGSDVDWEQPYVSRDRYESYGSPDFGELFSNGVRMSVDDGYGQDDFWSDAATDENQGRAFGKDYSGLEQEEDPENQVSDEELEDIFASMNKELKRDDGGVQKNELTEALLGPAANSIQTNRDSKRHDPEQDDIKLVDLSPEQITNLIQSVQDPENTEQVLEPNGEEDEEDEEGEQVTDEELGKIFSNDRNSEDDKKDINTERAMEEEEEDEESKDEVKSAAEEQEEQQVEEEQHEDEQMADDNDGDNSREINKEWLIAQYLDGLQGDSDVISRKIKRSGDGSYLATLESDTSRSEGPKDSQQDLATELAIAREDIKVLKTFLDKEDEENANLAYALNLATKSQTDRTDRYVDEEIEYIKKAIQNELDIQEVNDVLNIAATLDGRPDSVGDLRDFLEESKRVEPEVDEVDVPDQDEVIVDDGDLASDVTNGPDMEMSDSDLVRALLASKLQRLLSQASENSLAKMADKGADVEGWYDRPVPPSVEDVENDSDWYFNPLLRKLWQKYRLNKPNTKRGYPPQSYPASDVSSNTPIDLNTLEEVLAESLSKEGSSGEGTCPAVEEISSYCDFMADLGLELDDEAIQLCNRHEVCYTCGAAPYINLSADDCDRKYLEEAAHLCENRQGCDIDASRLFILMLRYHSYKQTRSPAQCAAPCTQEYISGPTYDK